MSIEVNLIKLRTSNWRSVEQAVVMGGNAPKLIEINEVIKLKKGSILIIPGVGNIISLVNEVSARSNIKQIRAYINAYNIKVIGVCLGYQWLCSKSFEYESAECLDLIDCIVDPIFIPIRPSVGWKKLNNSVVSKSVNPLTNILKDKFFYFTHSFGVKYLEFEAEEVYTYSPDGGASDLVAAIIDKNIIGYQFHPEKSGQHGVKLLSKSIEYLASK